jgi:hypothetical protein
MAASQIVVIEAPKTLPESRLCATPKSLVVLNPEKEAAES